MPELNAAPQLVERADAPHVALFEQRPVEPCKLGRPRLGRGHLLDTALLRRGAFLDREQRYTGLPFEGILEELRALHAIDPGRSFYLFLMLNDQRRHMAEHFEHIDLHRIEFQLPFYDSEFLELMVSSPVDLCLEHGFYNQWLQDLPPSMVQVPWQAYPGHEPCPLPMPKGLRYQWGPQPYFMNFQEAQKQRLLEDTGRLLTTKDFPDALLNKSYLRLATWAYRFSLRETSHVLQTARTVYRYAHRCNRDIIKLL